MVIWWGGIVRGAICFALSLRKTTTHSPVIITTTFAIVIVTTFAVGSLTETFLICIGMKDPDPTAINNNKMRKDTLLHEETSSFKRFIRRIDEKFVKPIFGGRKRKVHELSVDNPEFTHLYQKYQEKQLEKAVSSTRLWTSTGGANLTNSNSLAALSNAANNRSPGLYHSLPIHQYMDHRNNNENEHKDNSGSDSATDIDLQSDMNSTVFMQ